jgi:hypothetical protein
MQEVIRIFVGLTNVQPLAVMRETQTIDIAVTNYTSISSEKFEAY